MRILLVEDDRNLARNLQYSLQETGYIVKTVHRGDDALEEALVEEYDMIVLDIMLPGRDGLDVLKVLRENQINTPVLLLTARDRIEDKVAGLDSGADDYLAKPFAIAELQARIRALLRRKSDQKNPLIRLGVLSVNTLSHEVRVKDTLIELTPKEYAILEFMLYNLNRVVQRLSIAEHVWDDNFDLMTNVVDVHIKNIRKKIEAAGSGRIIHTVRGIGYIIKQEEKL